MKAKIDEHGWLLVERAGSWKEQLCPWYGVPDVHCGDWCPLFEEWEGGDEVPGTVILRCGRGYGFAVEADERKGKKEPT